MVFKHKRPRCNERRPRPAARCMRLFPLALSCLAVSVAARGVCYDPNHVANPNADTIRADLAKIKELGFTIVRVYTAVYGEENLGTLITSQGLDVAITIPFTGVQAEMDKHKDAAIKAANLNSNVTPTPPPTPTTTAPPTPTTTAPPTPTTTAPPTPTTTAPPTPTTTAPPTPTTTTPPTAPVVPITSPPPTPTTTTATAVIPVTPPSINTTTESTTPTVTPTPTPTSSSPNTEKISTGNTDSTDTTISSDEDDSNSKKSDDSAETSSISSELNIELLRVTKLLRGTDHSSDSESSSDASDSGDAADSSDTSDASNSGDAEDSNDTSDTSNSGDTNDSSDTTNSTSDTSSSTSDTDDSGETSESSDTNSSSSSDTSNSSGTSSPSDADTSSSSGTSESSESSDTIDTGTSSSSDTGASGDVSDTADTGTSSSSDAGESSELSGSTDTDTSNSSEVSDSTDASSSTDTRMLSSTTSAAPDASNPTTGRVRHIYVGNENLADWNMKGSRDVPAGMTTMIQDIKSKVPADVLVGTVQRNTEFLDPERYTLVGLKELIDQCTVVGINMHPVFTPNTPPEKGMEVVQYQWGQLHNNEWLQRFPGLVDKLAITEIGWPTGIKYGLPNGRYDNLNPCSKEGGQVFYKNFNAWRQKNYNGADRTFYFQMFDLPDRTDGVYEPFFGLLDENGNNKFSSYSFDDLG